MVLGVDVNLLSVLVAAVAAMVVGFLWYGPLFGKAWMRLSGVRPQKKSMMSGMLLGFLGALVLAFVLAAVIGLAGADTMGAGVAVAFWLWLGFSATHALGTVAWEGKSWSLFWLNALGGLVSLVIQGAILAAW